MELGFRWDLYSGPMCTAGTDGSGALSGYTLLLGPVYTGDPIHCKYLGPVRPLVHLNLCFTVPRSDIDDPVTSFKSALGDELAVGARRGDIDLRLGYRYYPMDRDNTLSGLDTNAGNGTLALDGLFMEIGYRFSFGGKAGEKAE